MRRRDVLLGSGAAVLTAPAIRSAQAQTGKPLVFGGSVPLSGAAAETGLNVNNGYLTAMSYVNDVLGGVEIAGERYRVELKLFDDASDPARATTLIQRQIDDGTNFFLGSFGSNIVLPTAAITERARKPMVQTGGGSDAIFTRGFKYAFGMYPRATRQFAPAAALFKTLKPAPATYSVIYTNDAFSKTAAEGVQMSCDQAGFKRLDAFELPQKPTDVSSVLGSVRGNTPDLLVCVMHDQDSLLMARQMVSTGTNVKLLFQGLGPQLASFREALGQYAEDLLCSTYWDEDVPYKDKFFGNSKKFASILPQQVHPPDRLSHRRRGRLHRDLCACHAGGEQHQARSGARRAGRRRLRDILQPASNSRPQGDGDALLMGGMIGQVQKGKLVIVFPAEASSADDGLPRPALGQEGLKPTSAAACG